MAAVPRRLKRIEVYCPEYETTATIRINDAHSSGTDHLEVDYRSPEHSHFTIAIPDDWTDQDLLELIFLPSRDPGKQNWPTWEIPAYDFVSFRLYVRIRANSGHWRLEKRAGAGTDEARAPPPQSPIPGFGEKYCSLSGLPSHSLESAGGAFLTVIFGQIFAYFAFSNNHSSRPGSVSGFMASTGHSGTQTPQSMHSSGWITSMFSPS